MSEDQQMTFDDLKCHKKSGTAPYNWHRRGTTYIWPFDLLGQRHHLCIERIRTREKTWMVWLGEDKPPTGESVFFHAKNLGIAQEAALYFFSQSLVAMVFFLYEGKEITFEGVIPMLEKQEAEWTKRGRAWLQENGVLS